MLSLMLFFVKIKHNEVFHHSLFGCIKIGTVESTNSWTYALSLLEYVWEGDLLVLQGRGREEYFIFKLRELCSAYKDKQNIMTLSLC